MESVIDIENVSKKFRMYYDRPLTLKERVIRGGKGAYREFWALRDVSFSVRKGSTVGLVGQNGSGKSTLLKLINRTMFPDGGKIAIRGRVASLIELGAGFHPELSGRENVYTNATVFGFTRDEITERIPGIIRFSELEEFIDSPVRTYSSGMYARLAFAVAIHVDADILLVDEILGVGDLNFQAKCADRIHAMRKAGTTILVVTHDMGTVDRLCDWGIWLDHGRKKDEGEPQYIQQKYMAFMSGQQEEREREEKKEAGKEQGKQEKEDGDGGRIRMEDVTGLGEHFGTGDVIFTDAHIYSVDGTERRSFQTGEAVRIRLDYRTQVRPEEIRANIGLEIRDMNGTLVYGTNTARDGSGELAVKKEGSIEIIIEDIPLLEGEYTIGAAIANQAETVSYDHYHEMFRIRVYSDKRDIGITAIKHLFIMDSEEVENGR